MGSGIMFKCKKCGTDYGIRTGIGFLFMNVYKDIVKKIKIGEYGEELKKLLEKDPGLAVDCGTDLFVCKCGNWTNETNLDVYEPVDEETRKKFTDTNGEMYVLPWELKEDFKLVKHHDHICEKCGKMMKQIKNPDYYAERYGLTCPECGEKNTADKNAGILWD